MNQEVTKGQELFFQEVIAMAPDATVAFGGPSNRAYNVRVTRATASEVTMRIGEDEFSDIASPGGVGRLSNLKDRLRELWRLSEKQ